MIAREQGSNTNNNESKRLKENSNLPDGWEERIDPANSKPYYVNLQTGTA
jgi:hypothetical protein